MDTQTLILIGVGCYMAIMVVVGFYASRGNQSLTDFVTRLRGRAHGQAQQNAMGEDALAEGRFSKKITART